MNDYPKIVIDLEKLQKNVECITRMCAEKGIVISGVIKGVNGIKGSAGAFDRGGAAFVASSRLEQIEDAIAEGIDKPTMLIRIPMLSEVSDVVRLTDVSLNSEKKVLAALNKEALSQGKKHGVIIMADIGDLREGFWDKDEMVEVCLAVENEMEGLDLTGVGTNVGCYGSILPSSEKLGELVEIAEKIEEKIGRRLEIISGGATSSLMRVMDGDIPERINHLRIGEAILLNVDLSLYYGYDIPGLEKDVIRLCAEVIEVKDKPSHPVGPIGVDAFGHRPEYVDRGIRRRALLAMGKVDYGDPFEIFPVDEGVEILGASSDHTILDIEDAKREIKVGDVLEFTINYASIVYVTSSRNVKHAYV